jgi:hypothetical protein
MGPETKNDCADEGQQQFTGLDWTGLPDQIMPNKECMKMKQTGNTWNMLYVFADRAE